MGLIGPRCMDITPLIGSKTWKRTRTLKWTQYLHILKRLGVSDVGGRAYCLVYRMGSG